MMIRANVELRFLVIDWLISFDLFFFSSGADCLIELQSHSWEMIRLTLSASRLLAEYYLDDHWRLYFLIFSCISRWGAGAMSTSPPFLFRSAYRWFDLTWSQVDCWVWIILNFSYRALVKHFQLTRRIIVLLNLERSSATCHEIWLYPHFRDHWRRKTIVWLSYRPVVWLESIFVRRVSFHTAVSYLDLWMRGILPIHQ